MKCNQSRPGFEIVSLRPFLATITITTRAPPKGLSPFVRYWGPFLMWTKDKLQQIYQRTIKLMMMWNAFHHRDDIDRLCVSSIKGGEGLTIIQDNLDISIGRLEHYIKKSKERLISATLFSWLFRFYGISTFVGYLMCPFPMTITITPRAPSWIHFFHQPGTKSWADGCLALFKQRI